MEQGAATAPEAQHLLGELNINELDETVVPQRQQRRQQRVFAPVERCGARICQLWNGCSGWFSECWAGTHEAARNWLRSVCPLSRHWSLRRRAFASCLENAASIGVMAILTLNIYSATFFLAWAEHDTICLVGKDTTFSDGLKYWVKVIIIGLPFFACPATLYIAGQAKALQTNRNALGYVSGLVICEYLFILLMGALMTVCMSASPYGYVVVVSGFLILLVLVTWGCCCYYPKFLRRCVVWTCCYHEVDVEAQELELDQRDND